MNFIKKHQLKLEKFRANETKILEKEMRKLFLKIQKAYPNITSFTSGNGGYWFNLENDNGIKLQDGEIHKLHNFCNDYCFGARPWKISKKNEKLFNDFFKLADFIYDSREFSLDCISL